MSPDSNKTAGFRLETSRRRFLPPACLLLPCLLFLFFFGRPFVQPQTLAFRDAGNFYYPLFAWQCRQWSDGRVPLWNPQADCGVPALADATSSTLYPGKLVFALPVPYRLRFHAYLAMHALWAAVSLYVLARRWRISREGATLGAMAYAFGGVVLFEYSNVVFLVSAAWLPWALLATDIMLRRRSVGGAIALSVVLALMTLGGDPQAAYHAGLAAALYALLLTIARWRRHSQRSHRPAVHQPAVHRPTLATRRIQLPRWRPTLLMIAALSSLLLAAAQVLPSAVWTRASDRATYETPRSIYEVVAAGASPAVLLEDPAPGTHAAHIYRFSVAPWRLLEWVWPNLYGKTFPINQRWISALPGESGIWSPSLYGGLLPLLLGLSCWSLLDRDLRIRWLSWLSLLAVIGSFGWYGLGWLVHEVRYGLSPAAADELWCGRPVGGLYWLLVIALPGYVYFRYPTKLLVFAALGMSLLAARGWDELSRTRSQWFPRTTMLLGGCSVAAAAALVLFRPAWQAWAASAPPDPAYGPLDAAGAHFGAVRSLVHTAIVCLFAWLAWRSHARTVKQRAKAKTAIASVPLPRLLLLATAVDLALAGGWMLRTVPSEVLERPPLLATAIADHASSTDREPSLSEPFRVYRASPTDGMPAEWARTSSPHRLTEVVAWEHATLLPRHHLLTSLPLVRSHGTLASRDFEAWLDAAGLTTSGATGSETVETGSEPPGVADAALQALSARYIVRPRTSGLPTRTIHLPDIPPLATDLPATLVGENAAAFPPAWIVREFEPLTDPPDHRPGGRRRDARKVLVSRGHARDLRRSAVVEWREPIRELPSLMPFDPDRETCRVVMNQPHHVQIHVDMDAPGLLVLNHLHYPGWAARRTAADGTPPVPLAIHRSNLLMRGVLLPAGRHTVDFHYRPLEFYIGAVISLLTALILAVSLVLQHASLCASASPGRQFTRSRGS